VVVKRARLDKLLVDRGLCQSRERATALIMAGKVLVAGIPATKAGSQVATDVAIELAEDDHPWVSRGALKLIHALDELAIDPSGKVAIDVGASTGGFTDVLLARGARRVFAIDVGYGQLDWKLRNDDRVTVLERENIRYLDPARLDEIPELAVIDVSFISLTKVLPKVRELLSDPERPIIALIKPQFEAGKNQVGKGGVVRDPEVRKSCIDSVQAFARTHGFEVGPVCKSPIRGPAGNVEFLQLLVTR
jgi:23S rRNA (cytidine1920-2'-O)/16S rRNA (cytidine1409-2'-O)-methyltransferase